MRVFQCMRCFSSVYVFKTAVWYTTGKGIRLHGLGREEFIVRAKAQQALGECVSLQ